MRLSPTATSEIRCPGGTGAAVVDAVVPGADVTIAAVEGVVCRKNNEQPALPKSKIKAASNAKTRVFLCVM